VWVGFEVDKGVWDFDGLACEIIYEGKETKIGSLFFWGVIRRTGVHV